MNNRKGAMPFRATVYQRRWALGAAAVVVALVALGVAYALLVPQLQNADEMYHLHYAQLIANHFELPGAHMTEKQQPPLYYLMGAIILKAGGSLTALRLMSVALGAVTVTLVMAIARELVPARPGIAVAAGVVTASLPMTVSVSASFTDDGLAWAAGAGLLWCTARVLRSAAASRRLLVTSGVAAGIGLLSKETDWVLVAGLALAVAMRLPRPIRLVDLAAVALPAAAVAGWWFVRNLVTFGGLVPPLQPLTTTHPYLRSLGELQVFASGAVRSLFGPERADGGALPRSFAVQVLIGVLFTMLALALVFAAVQAIRQHSQWDLRSRQIAMVFAAICGLLFAEWLLNSVLFDLQPQARYLFVAAAAPATALAWTGAMLVQRLGRRATVVLGGGLIIAIVFMTIDSLRVAITRNA